MGSYAENRQTVGLREKAMFNASFWDAILGSRARWSTRILGFRRPVRDAAVSVSLKLSLTVTTSLHSSAETHDVVNSFLEDALCDPQSSQNVRLVSWYERCHEDPL